MMKAARLLTLSGEKLANKKAMARLEIHANHYKHSLKNALRANFPVVCQLTGDDYFSALAERYIRKHPPSSPCLWAYGKNFAPFIQTVKSAASVACLADMARLEQARNHAMHAKDSTLISPEDFAKAFANSSHKNRVTLSPSLHLIQSPYNLLDIWNAHQQDEVPPTNLYPPQGSVNIAVHRPQYYVKMVPVSNDTASFIEGVMAHKSWQEALPADATKAQEVVTFLLAQQFFTTPTSPPKTISRRLP